MDEKPWRVIVVEACSDALNLYVDLITAPFLAVCRVVSDFIHSKGRYDHSDRGSRRAQ